MDEFLNSDYIIYDGLDSISLKELNTYYIFYCKNNHLDVVRYTKIELEKSLNEKRVIINQKTKRIEGIRINEEFYDVDV